MKYILILFFVLSFSNAENFVEDYTGSCGFTKDRVVLDVSIAKKNKDFIAGFRKQTLNISKQNFMDKSFMAPDLNSALLSYSLASKTSVLASFLGLNVILNTQMAAGPTKEAKKYIRNFSKNLTVGNCCIGYIYYARSYTKEFSPVANYSRALEILDSGKDSCLSKSVISTVKLAYYTALAKIRTFKKLKTAGRLK